MNKIRTTKGIRYIFTYSTLAIFLFISFLMVSVIAGILVYEIKEETRILELHKKELKAIQEERAKLEKSVRLTQELELEIERARDEALLSIQKKIDEEQPIAKKEQPKKAVKIQSKWIHVDQDGCMFIHDGRGYIPLRDGYGNQKGC